jgi:hypothetical protein
MRLTQRALTSRAVRATTASSGARWAAETPQDDERSARQPFQSLTSQRKALVNMLLQKGKRNSPNAESDVKRVLEQLDAAGSARCQPRCM